MADDNQDFFPELAQKPQSSSTDFFPELDKPAAKSFDLAGALKTNTPAAASNILPGLVEIPEQILNMEQFVYRQPGLGGFARMLNPAAAQLTPMAINAANRLAGAPPQPYMDVTGAMRANPALGFGGQTPAQLAQQQPVGGMVGTAIGQLPYFIFGGEAAHINKLPLLGRLAASGMTGAGIGGGAGALQEASTEAKTNDRLDPQRIASETFNNALYGAMVGTGFRGLGEAIGATARGIGGLFKGKAETPPPGAPPAPPPAPLALPGPTGPKQLPGPVLPRLLPGPTAPTGPKLIGRKITPMGPTERARSGNELYVPPFRAETEVHGQVIQPAVDEAGREYPTTVQQPKPTAKGKTKEPKVKVDATAAEPPLPPNVIEARVEKIANPDESWRTAREQAARPATSQEEPLARDLARNKIYLDAIGSKLREALRKMYAELRINVPKRAQQLDPKYALEMKEIAKALGATPKAMATAVESTLSPQSEFPEIFHFKGQTLAQKMEELKALSEEYKKALKKYERFKENHDEDFHETFPLNQTIQVNVTTKEYGTKSVNVRLRWQPSEYEFPSPQAKATYAAEKESRMGKSAPYPELTTEAFKRVVNQVLDKGTHLELEGLADQGALKWFEKLPKGQQASIVLAIGATAALYGSGQQPVEAQNVPPNLAGRVVTKLFKNGYKEWMGSRPITAATKLDLTTDMIRRGFDAESKNFFALRMQYEANLKRANVGARHMTPEEKQATQGMAPRDLRRPASFYTSGKDPLQGWTTFERQKAGDIAYYNQQYKSAIRDELKRLKGLNVDPGHFGQARRYARGVQIDAHDMGIDLGMDDQGNPINPVGSSPEALNKLTGEVMKSEFLGNLRVAIGYHTHEALMATVSKYPGAFARAVHGLATNPTYREFAIANSPHGFFQQLLESQRGFKYRQNIDKFVNGPIDAFLKKTLGEVGYDALSAQLPERAKLGLNAVVIAEEEAKNYPGGSQQYMKDWLASAKQRQAVPAARQTDFAKAALKCMVEENIATGSLPDGPLKERTVFQRTQAFTLVIAYTRGKIQQSRFVFSLLDDAMAAAATGDKAALSKALRAFLIANLMIYGAAGSATVPPYIWAALEQIDRTFNGNANAVGQIKDMLDAGQKNIGPGYQIRHLGLAGAPVTTMPSGAVSGLTQQVRMPTSKEVMVRDAVDFATLTLLSRLGPEGALNLQYMAERIYMGITGKEDFKQYEEGIASVAAAKAAGKPVKLTEKRLPFDLGQGVLHAVAPVQNPQEVQEIQRAERRSAQNFPRNVRMVQRKISTALKK